MAWSGRSAAQCSAQSLALVVRTHLILRLPSTRLHPVPPPAVLSRAPITALSCTVAGTLVTGDSSGNLELWALASGDRMRALGAHQGYARTVLERQLCVCGPASFQVCWQHDIECALGIHLRCHATDALHVMRSARSNLARRPPPAFVWPRRHVLLACAARSATCLSSPRRKQSRRSLTAGVAATAEAACCSRWAKTGSCAGGMSATASAARSATGRCRMPLAQPCAGVVGPIANSYCSQPETMARSTSGMCRH